MCDMTHSYASHHASEWVMSRIRMSHVTHKNKSCHAYEWVMSPICMTIQEPYLSFLGLWVSVVTDYHWVVSHVWMLIHELPYAWRSKEPYMSFLGLWVSHVTNIIESRHTYEWGMSRVWMLIHELLHVFLGTVSESCHRPSMRHVTRMHVDPRTLICPSGKFQWVMSHTWMRYVTHTNESCHTYERIVTHIWKRTLSTLYVLLGTVKESCHTHEWVISHAWMSHITHMKGSRYTH